MINSPMKRATFRLLFAAGLAAAMTSCQTPQAAADPYGTNAVGAGYPPAPAQGTYGGAYNTNQGGNYSAPSYGTPPVNNNNGGGAYDNTYSSPPSGNAGGIYDNAGASGGGYDAGAGAASGGGSGRTHRVVSGDTLSSLSRRYGTNIPALMRANNLNSSTIRIGESLRIP
jgi:hypothetical protein